jgi:hypothetical protein
VTYRSLDPVKLEVGWDDTVHRATLEKGETVVFKSPHPGRSGYILPIPVMGPSEFSFWKTTVTAPEDPLASFRPSTDANRQKESRQKPRSRTVERTPFGQERA